MSLDLLREPITYAKKAVAILEYQLETAKSSYRKIKLNSKIKEWKKFVELMESSDEHSEAPSGSNEA